MYWDSLPDMQELTGMNSKWATTLMAQHLLAAADRYALERLRLICEVSLCEDVAINTVATTLALAEQHHCFQLKAVCLKFIATSENLRGMLFLSKLIHSTQWYRSVKESYGFALWSSFSIYCQFIHAMQFIDCSKLTPMSSMTS